MLNFDYIFKKSPDRDSAFLYINKKIIEMKTSLEREITHNDLVAHLAAEKAYNETKQQLDDFKVHNINCSDCGDVVNPDNGECLNCGKQN